MREVVNLIKHMVDWVLADIRREADDGGLVGGDGFAGLVLLFPLYQIWVKSLYILIHKNTGSNVFSPK